MLLAYINKHFLLAYTTNNSEILENMIATIKGSSYGEESHHRFYAREARKCPQMF
jgi:hypothetical protein